MKTQFITLALTATLGFGAVGVTTFIAVPTEAVAQTRSAKAIVDQAIKDGIIGETAGGYLAVVSKTSDTKIVQAMNEINIGRKTLYTSTAREENVPVEQVAALFGEKQLAAAKPGEKILNKQGRWVTR